MLSLNGHILNLVVVPWYVSQDIKDCIQKMKLWYEELINRNMTNNV